MQAIYPITFEVDTNLTRSSDYKSNHVVYNFWFLGYDWSSVWSDKHMWASYHNFPALLWPTIKIKLDQLDSSQHHPKFFLSNMVLDDQLSCMSTCVRPFHKMHLSHLLSVTTVIFHILYTSHICHCHPPSAHFSLALYPGRSLYPCIVCQLLMWWTET